MNKGLDKEVAEAERNLEALKNKQNAQRYELPVLEEKIRRYVGYGYSDAYIESKMWASRSQNIGIADITNVIQKVRNCNVIQK
jgi:hypothetical protein